MHKVILGLNDEEFQTLVDALRVYIALSVWNPKLQKVAQEIKRQLEVQETK
jgi:hypothetical protein